MSHKDPYFKQPGFQLTAQAELSRLAHLEDYCIEKDGNFSINPRAAPGDQWAPFAGGNREGRHSQDGS